MTVSDIVKEYLVANGFDGLCLPGECGCGIEDIHPCDVNENVLECEPAHRILCNQSMCKNEDCEYAGDAKYCFTTIQKPGA
jgi:hypothetical protein